MADRRRESAEADAFYADLIGLRPRRPTAARPRGDTPADRRMDGPISPARLFDSIVHRALPPAALFAQEGEDAGEEWDIIALPRSATPRASLAEGALVVGRALGEGNLGFLQVLGEDVQVHQLYGRDGRIRPDVLVLQHRVAPAPLALRESEAIDLVEDVDDDPEARSSDSRLDVTPLDIDPDYNRDDDSVSPVWAQSDQIRALVKSPRTDQASRNLLEEAAQRQLKTALLYERLSQAFSATKSSGQKTAQILYVILFPGEARDNTGIKDLNDKVLGPRLHDEYIRARHAHIRTIFNKAPFTVVGQDYKTALVLASASDGKDVVDTNRKAFDAVLRDLDAKLKTELLTLLRKTDPTYEKEARKLRETLEKSKDYRFDIYYGFSACPSTVAPLLMVFLLLTETLKGAGLSRFAAKGGSLKTGAAKKFAKDVTRDKKFDGRGKRFEHPVFLDVSNRATKIKRTMLQPPTNDNYLRDYNHILIDTVWTVAFFERQFVSNPDVVRDARKKLLQKPQWPNYKPTFKEQKELLELWLVILNVLDFIKDFRLDELAVDVRQYHDAAVAVMQNVRKDATIDQKRLEEFLTRDVTQKRLAVLQTASEFLFYATAADHAQRIFFSMDIRDLGVEVMQIYEGSGAVIGDKKLKDRALLEESIRATDDVVDRRRFTYQTAVQTFGRYHNLLTNASRMKRTDGVAEARTAFGKDARWQPNTMLGFDDDVQIMLGGDEIFVAADPRFAAYVHNIVADLDAAQFNKRPLNMRACVAISDGTSASTRGKTPREIVQKAHDQVMQLADKAHGVLKRFERTHRRIERLIEKLAENPKKQPDAPKFTEQLTKLRLMKLWVRANYGKPVIFDPKAFARVIAKLKAGECDYIEVVDFKGTVVDCRKLLDQADALEKAVRKLVGDDNVRKEPPPMKGRKPKKGKDPDDDKKKKTAGDDDDDDGDEREIAVEDDAVPEEPDQSFLRWEQGMRATYFPPRRAGAIKGHALMETIKGEGPPADWVAREKAIANALLGGNMPDKLLRWERINLTLTKDGRTITGTVEVLPDYLAVGSDDDFVHVPLDPVTAQLVADKFDCILPTARICHAIYLQTSSKNRINSIERDYFKSDANRTVAKRGRAQTSTAAYLEHSEAIRAKMTSAGIAPGELVAGHKKDVVIARRLFTDSEKIAFHGFYDAAGYPHEPCYENSAGTPQPSCARDTPTLAHSRRFSDYSQGVRLVHPWMIVNGQRKMVADVLADPDLSYLISSEGPIVPARIPKTSKPTTGPFGSVEAADEAVPQRGRGRFRHEPLGGDAGDNVEARWNVDAATTSGSTIDVVVHLHGYGAPAPDFLGRKAAAAGVDLVDAAGAVQRRASRPTLALVPRGHNTGGSRWVFDTLPTRAAFDGLVDAGLSWLCRTVLGLAAGSTLTRGRLTVMAHSGGGAGLSALLASGLDPDEVVCFDSMYGGEDPIRRWAEARIASPNAARSGLRAFYTGCSADSWSYWTSDSRWHLISTEVAARRLHDTVTRALSRASGGASLAARFRVERTAIGHSDIPSRYSPPLLDDIGAPLPGAAAPPPATSRPACVANDDWLTGPPRRPGGDAPPAPKSAAAASPRPATATATATAKESSAETDAEAVYAPPGGRAYTPSSSAALFRTAPSPVAVTAASQWPEPTTDADGASQRALRALGVDAAGVAAFAGAGLAALRPIASVFGEPALTELLRRLRYTSAQLAAPPHSFDSDAALTRTFGRAMTRTAVLGMRTLLAIPGHFRELARQAGSDEEAFALENLGWLLLQSLRDDVRTSAGIDFWLPASPMFVTPFANPVPALSPQASRLVVRRMLIDTTLAFADYRARFSAWQSGAPGRLWRFETGRDTSAGRPAAAPFYPDPFTIPASINIAAQRAQVQAAWTRRVADFDARRTTVPLTQCDGSFLTALRLMASISLRGLQLRSQFPSPRTAPGLSSLTGLAAVQPAFEAVFQAIADLGWNDLLFETQGMGCFRGKKIPGSPTAARTMSEHSLGIAVDLNAFENAQNTAGSMDPRIVALFEAFRFRWGRGFSTPDPMHFEYAG